MRFILITTLTLLAISCNQKVYVFNEKEGKGFYVKRKHSQIKFVREVKNESIKSVKAVIQVQLHNEVYSIIYSDSDTLLLSKDSVTYSKIFIVPFNFYQFLGNCGITRMLDNNAKFKYEFVERSVMRFSNIAFDIDHFRIFAPEFTKNAIAEIYLDRKTGIPMKFEYIICRLIKDSIQYDLITSEVVDITTRKLLRKRLRLQ